MINLGPIISCPSLLVQSATSELYVNVYVYEQFMDSGNTICSAILSHMTCNDDRKIIQVLYSGVIGIYSTKRQWYHTKTTKSYTSKEPSEHSRRWKRYNLMSCKRFEVANWGGTITSTSNKWPASRTWPFDYFISQPPSTGDRLEKIQLYKKIKYFVSLLATLFNEVYIRIFNTRTMYMYLHFMDKSTDNMLLNVIYLLLLSPNDSHYIYISFFRKVFMGGPHSILLNISRPVDTLSLAYMHYCSESKESG